MSEELKCPFDNAWIGQCGRLATAGGFCEEHTKLKCASCGNQATRSCDHTGIQFVCGAHLCKNCRHGIPEEGKPGWFLLGGGHVTQEVFERQFQDRYGHELNE